MKRDRPGNTGLYRHEFEHDSCGIGFVAQIHGKKSHDIIVRGLDILRNMTHRGAEGADSKTGDGAGVLIQIPRDFYLIQGYALPPEGQFGTGLLFLPQDEGEGAFETRQNDSRRHRGRESLPRQGAQSQACRRISIR
ncbi:MAG: hypothetical protein K0B05_04535 [Bacteroidales bacterium]|nr:hypothetical protein [Bacteroidales bacterium]